MQYTLLETATEAAFLKQATDTLEQLMSGALAKTGRCTVGLCGGSTPIPIYRELAQRPIDWANVTLFLVDERYVAPTHADSNQRMIREELLTPIGLPPEKLLAPETTKPLEECVHAYEQSMKELFAHAKPDAIVLGMGEDGHIASLFPPLTDDALDPSRFAVSTHTDRFAVSERISLTLPQLLSAEHLLLFLQGRLKKRTWTTMLEDAVDHRKWPGQAMVGTGRSTIVAQWSSKEQES